MAIRGPEDVLLWGLGAAPGLTDFATALRKESRVAVSAWTSLPVCNEHKVRLEQD